MTSWTWRPPPPRPGGGRLAAARDVAIIAVCVAILAFALLAAWGLSAPAERPASPAPARLSLIRAHDDVPAPGPRRSRPSRAAATPRPGC